MRINGIKAHIVDTIRDRVVIPEDLITIMHAWSRASACLQFKHREHLRNRVILGGRGPLTISNMDECFYIIKRCCFNPRVVQNPLDMLEWYKASKKAVKKRLVEKIN